MLKVAKLAKVPVYIAEWNDASHKDMAKGKKGFHVHAKNNQDDTAAIDSEKAQELECMGMGLLELELCAPPGT